MKFIREYNQFEYSSNMELFSDMFLSISDEFNLLETIYWDSKSSFTRSEVFDASMNDGWWSISPTNGGGLEFSISIKESIDSGNFRKVLGEFFEKFKSSSGLEMVIQNDERGRREYFKYRMVSMSGMLISTFLFVTPKYKEFIKGGDWKGLDESVRDEESLLDYFCDFEDRGDIVRVSRGGVYSLWYLRKIDKRNKLDLDDIWVVSINTDKENTSKDVNWRRLGINWKVLYYNTTSNEFLSRVDEIKSITFKIFLTRKDDVVN